MNMPRIKDHIKDIFSRKRKFEYLPLNPDRKEIRVLIFEDSSDKRSAKASSTLKCRLEHVSLLDEPKLSYYSVSYCWGENPPLAKIILNGKEALVPSSAIGALSTVCHPVHGKRDLPVWIDAICINQADDLEKGHQVAMMAEIYSKASEVLIWLGDADDSTESGIEAINAVVTARSNGTRVDQHFFPDMNSWVNLTKVFDSPYFGRLWPVQEICLSASALCWRGKFRINWDSVLVLEDVLDEVGYQNPDIVQYPGADKLSDTGYVKLIQAEKSLENVLDSCIMFETTDPRDKIYATLGLLDPDMLSAESWDLLRPDYSLPVRDVYVRATIAALRSARQVQFLTCAQEADPTRRYTIPEERKGDPFDLPSWVPRYDLIEPGPPAIRWVTRGSDGPLPALFDTLTDLEDVLCVQGVVVGKITSVNLRIPFLPRGERNVLSGVEKLAVYFMHLWEMDAGAPARDIRDALKQIALTHAMFCRTSNATDEDEHEVVAGFGAFISRCKDYCQARTGDSFERWLGETGADRGNAQGFVEMLFDEAWDRHFAKTSTGHYAMTPLFTKPGDMICILFGCKSPLILRPRGREYRGRTGEFWQLIGEAYVCGIMGGEHIDMLREEGRLESETRGFNLI